MKYLKKFESYVYFQKDLDEIIDAIKDLPIIEDLRKCPNNLKNRLFYHAKKDFFYHDYEDSDEYNLTLVKHKRRTKPSDTPIILHEYISKKLENKLGWNPREDTIFVHNGELSSYKYGDYGENFILFPKGKYDLVWNDTTPDMYNALWERFESIKKWRGIPHMIGNPTNDEEKQELDEMYVFLDEYAETFKDIKDYDLCKWFDSGVEGMLKSEAYYLIHDKFENDILQFIYGQKKNTQK